MKPKALGEKNVSYPNNKDLFKRAERCYTDAAKIYPFLQYKINSVKSSLYGLVGRLFGIYGIL